jgi:formylglycine-generating enzyme required for sulfatase activity
MSDCCGPSRDAGREVPSRPAVAAPVADNTSPDGADLVSITSATFRMGTDDPRGYPADGEGPIHAVEVSTYSIGRHAVTNAEFARFVEATGYVTTAEQFGDSFVFAGLLPDDFPPTRGVAAAPWWRQVEGADWWHPEGPQSDITGRADHPVVHVSWDDAAAYTTWSGTRLPTEAQWEHAARGGLDGVHFPWGADVEPDGEHRMNVFQGRFPERDTGDDGWVGTCPVGSFPANGLGLFEMTGNVWEWCSDWFDPGFYARSPTRDPDGPSTGTARVMRGGSYLCHESYCWRYRVDARSSNHPDSSAGNIGFRVAAD